MPDPIGPSRTLPGLPSVPATSDTVGVPQPLDTGVTGQPTVPDNAVEDVMERNRRRPDGTVPNFVRTTTVDRTNGRSVLDVRVETNGAVVRGTREDTDPSRGTTRTDTGTLGVDGNAVAISVERTTTTNRDNVTGTRVLGGTLHGDTTTGVVTGTITTRGGTTITAPDGSTRTTGDSGELRTDGSSLGGHIERTVENRNADGTGVRRDGRLEGNVTTDGADGTLRGRTVITGNNVTTELGAEVNTRVDRTGVHGTVRFDGSHDRTVTDGRTTIRGNVTVDGNGPNGNVDLERTRGTDADRTTIRGNVNGDLGGIRGNGTIERTRTVDGGTRTLGGGLNTTIGRDGFSVEGNGRTSTVTTVNSVVSTRVLAVTGRFSNREVGGEISGGRTVEDAANNRRHDFSGTLRGGLSDGQGTVTLNAATTGNTGVGRDRVAWNVNSNLDATTNGVTATIGGNGVFGDPDASNVNIDGNATVNSNGDGTHLTGRLGGSLRDVQDIATTTLRSEVSFTDLVPSISVGRSDEDARTGRATDLGASVDVGALSGNIRLADRTVVEGGNRHDRELTTGLNVPGRTVTLGLGTAVTNADGVVVEETHHSVEGGLPEDGHLTAGVGRETVRRRDGNEHRTGGRVAFTGGGILAEGGHAAVDANGLSTRHTVRTEVTPDGVDARHDTYRSGGDGNAQGTTRRFVANRTGIDGELGHGEDDGKGNIDDRKLSLGLGPGTVRGGSSTTHSDAQGNSTMFGGRFGVGSGRLEALVNANREWATSAGRLSLGLAGHAVSASTVDDEGEVTDLPGLSGMHRVVLKSEQSVDAALSAGVTIGAVGIGGGVRKGTGKTITYVTHTTAQDAARMAAEGGARRYARTSVLPDPEKPLALKQHDQLRISTQGDLDVTADLSIAGIGVAGRVTMRGEFNFTVERLAGNKVRIEVSPVSVKSLALEGRALVAVAGIEGARASSLTQSYELDLGTPAGRGAYVRALDGKLPELKLDKQLANVDTAVNVIDTLNTTLPEGVRAHSVTSEKSTRVTRSSGFAWAFFVRDRQDSRTDSDRRVAEAGRVTTERTLETERNVRTWFSGREKSGTFATLQQVTTVEGGKLVTAFQDITLGARFSDEKVRGLELNEEVIDKLRNTLGMDIPHFAVEGDKESRSVEVALNITAEQLDALTGEDISRLKAAATDAGAPTARALVLGNKLRAARSAAERANAIQAFVQELGLPGLGTIMRAFPSLEARLHTASSAYEGALQAADAQLGTHAGPPAAGMDEGAFSSLVAEVHEAMHKVDAARIKLAGDTLVDQEQFKTIDADLVDRRAKLDALIDVSAWTADERRTLWEDLDRGWTTAKDDAAMKVLAEAGLGSA